MITAYSEYTNPSSQWIDTIPTHWRLGRLDQVARAWPSNVDKHSVEGETSVRLCNYTDVYKNSSIVEGMSFMEATASDQEIDRFRLVIGDTLLTKDSETADDIGVPAFVEYEAPDLLCGYHLSIVRPDSSRVNPKFLYWALGAGPTLGQWAVLASGVTRVGLKAGDLAKVTLAFPSLSEQRAIADYLDRETARVDTLIEEQQRLIEMLRERRRAVIEWRIADIEADRAALRYCARLVSGSGFPVAAQGNVDEELPFFKVKDLQSADHHGILLPAADTVSRDTAATLRATVIPRGSIVFAKVGAALKLGRVGSLPVDGCIDNNMSALIFDSTMDPYFARYVLLTFDFGRFVHPGAVPSLNMEAVREFKFPLVSRDRQRSIVENLDEEIAKIDELIAESERFIELSRERRAALITAAVTGQIDVREVA